MRRNLLLGTPQFWATVLLSSSATPTIQPSIAWVSTSARRHPAPRWSPPRSHSPTDQSSFTRHQGSALDESKVPGSSTNEPAAMGKIFRPGDEIQVEVVSFGPLGASVEVIGVGHGEDVPLLPADAEPYGTGLILQSEISYFRKARRNVDVVRGEVLPAYVQQVREEDGKLNISLRKYGGKAKAAEVENMIVDRLEATADGRLPIGEKSSPADINREFPGVSKVVFKNALGGLYKKGLVRPGHDSIELMKER